jgi:hypothetical protein
MAFKLGMHAVMYIADTLLDGSTNTPDAATWTEQSNVKDLTLNLETGEADATTRGNNGWRATLATLKEGSIEFEMLWDSADSGFTAIKDAWLNSTEIAMAAMDGDIQTSGNQGLASNFTVTNFSRNEPLEEAITVNVTVKPSSQTDWYEVS